MAEELKDLVPEAVWRELVAQAESNLFKAFEVRLPGETAASWWRVDFTHEPQHGAQRVVLDHWVVPNFHS